MKGAAWLNVESINKYCENSSVGRERKVFRRVLL